VWNNFSSIFVRLGVFAALYCIIAFVAIIIRSIRINRRLDKIEYDPQFSEFLKEKNYKGKK
jgi:hypothetical protein